jgi:hypothetical protein
MRQAAHFGSHHWLVGPDYSAATKTVPKHLVNRHLTSLVSGAIIDETGRRREDSRFSEAVCLGNYNIYNDFGRLGAVLFPRQVR